ncbi:MAG: glycosyltransferase family 4 protein [Candidatus Bathyarchaeales archaeon]
MVRLKVAVFNTQPPHLFFGGVERRIIETGKRLQGKVGIEVYCGTKAGFNKMAIVDGITLIPCFSTDLFFPIDNWFFNKSLGRRFKAIKADVFEAHTVSGYGFLKAMKQHKIKKPFIQTIHGVLADEYIQSLKFSSPTLRTKFSRIFMRKLSEMEKYAAKNADLIVTVSKYSLSKMVELYGVDTAKIRVVPNGVDVKRFRPAQSSKKLRRKVGVNDNSCVLFVGNLIPRKGVHFLIEAARYVLKENKRVVFLIVGDGPLKNYLVSYSKIQGVSENFVFLGNVSDSMLPAIYNCADVFVLPSIQEGQGITLLEAQASAKPVVAFHTGGIDEFVLNKKTGFLVKPDSCELANAILNLLSNERLRNEMGRYARKFICENFSWDSCAEKMFTVYCEALKQNT